MAIFSINWPNLRKLPLRLSQICSYKLDFMVIQRVYAGIFEIFIFFQIYGHLKFQVLFEISIYQYAPKYLKKPWKIDKFLLKKFQKVLNPYLSLINPRYFSQIWQHTQMMASATMQKTRNFQWPVLEKMSKNPNFWWLIPLNTWIKIFFKILAVSLSLLYWPLTSGTVSDKTNERFQRYLNMDGPTDQGMDRQTNKGITMDPTV